MNDSNLTTYKNDNCIESLPTKHIKPITKIYFEFIISLDTKILNTHTHMTVKRNESQ